MKKIICLVMIFALVFITGCGKDSSNSAFKDLTNKITSLKSYSLNGKLEVTNNDDTHTYNVAVSYMSKDKFRVSLTNTANNHEQVILRNDEGVYV